LKLYPLFILALFFGVYSSSCKSVYQNTLFQNADSTFIRLNDDYLIRSGDEISIKLYSRKGANLVEAIRTSVTNLQENGISAIATPFIVSNTGTMVIPIIGTLRVEGMTESQLKSTLENKFQQDYIEPFVYLKVENRRVFLFKGNIGAVIPLNRTPTSIFEVIAKSGGVDRFMSTSNIMIIRGDLKKPQVYHVDLQTFKGIQTSETILQANDIIYIPEKQRKLYYTMQDISTVAAVPLAIISGVLTTVVLLVTITK
jgi:polysaccharide biosynthesis/export protein